MTAYQLSSARLVLERARLLLREREDTDAYELRGQVTAAISAIAVAEGTTLAPDDASYLLSRAQSLTARTRAYADRHRLKFLIVLTPVPGELPLLLPPAPAEDHALDTTELLSVIASMKPGAETPPASVQDALEEAVLVSANEPRDTIPAPAETRNDLPMLHDSPTPPSFRRFHEEDDDG